MNEIKKQPLLIKCRLKRRTFLDLGKKVYVYICPISNIKKDDWIVAEVTKGNMPCGFSVGKVEEIIGELDDQLIKKYHPTSLVIAKLACKDFEERCYRTVLLKSRIFEKFYGWDYNPAKKIKKVEK